MFKKIDTPTNILKIQIKGIKKIPEIHWGNITSGPTNPEKKNYKTLS